MVNVHWRKPSGAGPGVDTAVPPAHPDLRNKGLRALSGAHFGLADPARTKAYLQAIVEATPAEIELARLQVRHFLVSVSAHLDSAGRTHPLLADIDRETPAEALAGAVEGVAADVAGHLLQLERDPGDAKAMAALADSLAAIAEAEAMTVAIARRSPDLSALADRASHLAGMAFEASGRLGERASAMGPAQAARAEAALSVATQAGMDELRLNPGVLGSAIALCGTLRGLWQASQEPFRADEIRSFRHVPFDESRAEALREIAVDLGAAYDSVFHGTGFAAFVRQAAVAARWSGMRLVEASFDTGEKDRIRARFARVAATPGSEEAARLDAEMGRMIDALPGRRAANGRRGVAMLAASEGFASLVRDSNPDARPVPVLRLRSAGDGVVVGRFDGGEGVALVIAEDSRVPTPGHVCAALVPDALLDAGVPTIHEMWDHPFDNYPSLGDALGWLAIRDRRLMGRLAGGKPFSVVDETAMEPEPEAGPRR